MGHASCRCCGPPPQLAGEAREGEDSWDCRRPTNRVQLAVSELFSVPGFATAYHTSVLVNDEEFFFSDSGIFSDRALTSHQGNPSEPLADLGLSGRTGYQLLCALRPHFLEGSYDLVRKNCNSFSDCAIHYLLGRRLDRKYTLLERLGMRAGADMVERVMKGMYRPNAAADGFSVPGVIAAVEKVGDADMHGSTSKPALVTGAGVTLVGLKNSQNLNGVGATVLRFNPVNGRWEAQLHVSGEVKAFRAENLRPAGELVLEPGDLARIHGLASEHGKELNGREGEVLNYVHDSSQYRVRVGNEVRDFRGENLEALKLGSDTKCLPSDDAKFL